MTEDPKILKNTHSRRIFLSKVIKAGILISLPVYKSCDLNSGISDLSDTNRIILLDALKFLWPDDGGGPTVENAGMYDFFIWMLSDTNVDPEEKEYLMKGLAWIDETSVEDHGKHYDKLSNEKKLEILEKVKSLDWGMSWYSKVINIIFEALFSDPIYGSNTDGVSYKWLNHNPGYPRPGVNNKYQDLMKRKEENETINNIEQLLLS